MTPERRLTLAFWLGCMQAAAIYGIIMDINPNVDGGPWYLYAIVWLVVLFFYVRNSGNFLKETLWMTIKNPGKVTFEDTSHHAGRLKPNRPPPPPAPPMPRVRPRGNHDYF